MDEKNNITPEIDDEKDTASEVKEEPVSANAEDISDEAEQAAEETSQEVQPGEEYVPQFGDIMASSYDEQAPVKVKKKSPVMPCIIISVCILLAAVIAGVVFLLFFNTSVTGAYIIEGSDTEGVVQTYFILEENGILTQRAGSIELEGTYEITTEDNVSKITFDIPANYVNVTYNYTLEGNKLTGMKILMSDDSGSTMTFVPVTYEETVVEPIEGAQLDSKLIGTWEDTAGYGLVYTFNEDNTLVMSGNGMNIYCVYSAENDTVDIRYQSADVVDNSAAYSFDGDLLILNSDSDYELEFAKVE